MAQNHMCATKMYQKSAVSAGGSLSRTYSQPARRGEGLYCECCIDRNMWIRPKSFGGFFSMRAQRSMGRHVRSRLSSFSYYIHGVYVGKSYWYTQHFWDIDFLFDLAIEWWKYRCNQPCVTEDICEKTESLPNKKRNSKGQERERKNNCYHIVVRVMKTRSVWLMCVALSPLHSPFLFFVVRFPSLSLRLSLYTVCTLCCVSFIHLVETKTHQMFPQNYYFFQYLCGLNALSYIHVLCISSFII